MAKKRVVVIGGSSGMGFGVAKLLHKHGYEVIIASRTKEKLEKAKKQLGKVTTHVLDLKNEKEISSFFSKVGPFDHLVTSAADFYMEPFVKGKTEDARNYFDSKFWGQYCAAKYAAPKIRKEGSITFFSGASNDKPMLNFAAGTAINGAIEGLTRALALELAPLRVNTISPGFVITELWDFMPKKDRMAIFEQTAAKLPAKRMGLPEDIALGVKFLIECGYATGTVLHVEGGHPLV